MDEEEIKMDDGVARFFTRFGGNLFYLLTCGRRSLVSGTENEIVVSISYRLLFPDVCNLISTAFPDGYVGHCVCGDRAQFHNDQTVLQAFRAACREQQVWSAATTALFRDGKSTHWRK